MALGDGKKSNKAIFKAKKNRFRKQDGPGGAKIVRGLGTVIITTVLIGLGVAVLVGLSLGAYTGYRWLTVIPYFGLKQVEVVGNHRLSYGEILTASELSLGLNTLGVNIRKIETDLSRLPWVESAAVERILPDKLRIQVTEREAWFWVRRDGNLYYADAQGKVIAQVEAGKFVSLPVLYLEDDTNAELPIFQDWVRSMNRKSLPVAFAELAWVRFGPRNGLELYIEDKDLHLFITDVSAFSKCLENAKKVWADLERRGELSSGMSIRAAIDRVWVEKKIISQG